MLRRPERDTPAPTVVMAMFAGFLCASGFVGLMAVVMPGILLMLLAFAGFVLLFVAQYFLWGRWLFRYVVEKERLREASNNSRTT